MMDTNKSQPTDDMAVEFCNEYDSEIYMARNIKDTGYKAYCPQCWTICFEANA